MVYFLFHALYLAIKNVATVSESRDTENVEFISQLTSYLLLYVQEIVRSGNARDLFQVQVVVQILSSSPEFGVYIFFLVRFI